MTESIFTNLGIVLAGVIITLGIMKLLKQPLIIWYIVAGTLISIFFPEMLHNNHSFETFSSIGIAFLLFMVWMELNPKIIKELGKSSMIAWFLQVLITAWLWWWLAMLLWFDAMTSIYIWVGFSFSSTIVILKLLSDKSETETVFGRLSIWILIVQDIIVMLLFLAIATIAQIWDSSGWLLAWQLTLKVILLTAGIYAFSRYIIPKVTKKIAESQEYLFLFAIAWCFAMWSLFHWLWFGIEIWALVAWVTLATSAYRYEIMSRVKSLRDFFIVMFFVLLWSHVDFGLWVKLLPQVLLFTAFVLIVKPLIISTILWFMGHIKKNAFLSGISLAQISEFSFLFLWMWIAAGYVKDPNVLTVVTMVWLLTIAVSSYFILFGSKIHSKLKLFVKYLPGKVRRPNKKDTQTHEIILFGYGRFGSQLYETLNKNYKNILVVDQDPKVINKLQRMWINCMYGDGWDLELLNEINLKHTKMVVSTISSFDDSILLSKTIKNKDKNIILILVSNHLEESIELYEQWADYVIMPHYLWAKHTSLLLEDYGFDITKFINHKHSQIHQLRTRHKKDIMDLLR